MQPLASGELVFVPQSQFDRVADLNDGQAKVATFAALARLNCLSMIMMAGSGHIGSSFSSLDLVSWVYLRELTEGTAGLPDMYFSSKGHDVPGLYCVLHGLKVLPDNAVEKLRRLGGLPGHPDVHTPGMWVNAGSLGMGISKAKGFIEAARLAGTPRRVFVMTGDGELQEGQNWEALVSAANRKMSELTVIVDHNKLQSDTYVKDTSDLGDLEAKFAAFGWATARCDGHALGAIDAAFRALDTAGDKPRVLIADTIKGRGVSFMEHTAMAPDQVMYGFHSGAPSAENYARAVAELLPKAEELFDVHGLGDLDVRRATKPAAAALPDDAIKLLPAYADALLDVGGRNENVVVLDADLMLDTGLIPFKGAHPERYIECGIAEQDMVSQAGGLALAGRLPMVHSFACFLTPRANEHFYTNATEGSKIIYAGFLAGLLPSGPGHSHQSVRDISALAAVPGLCLFQPSSEREVKDGVAWAVEQADHSVYFRMTSLPRPRLFDLPADYRLAVGKGVSVAPGADAVMFAYGPTMLGEAVTASRLLAEQGIGLEIVNLPWLNRLDADWLLATVAGRPVFTLDDHFIQSGQGDMIAAALARAGASVRVRSFGVTRVPDCGQNDEVLRSHGLDGANLAAEVAKSLGR